MFEQPTYWPKHHREKNMIDLRNDTHTSRTSWLGKHTWDSLTNLGQISSFCVQTGSLYD